MDRLTSLSDWVGRLSLPSWLRVYPQGSAHWAHGIAAGVTLAISVAFFSGCTMMRLGYGHLDTFAASMADEYFELDPNQKQEFTTRFERLHQWHRRVQLPDTPRS